MKHTGYIAILKHESSADGTYQYRETKQECIDLVHEFFLSYGFEMKDGNPYDPEHEDGDNGGFSCFDNIEIVDGKMAAFMHCDGDGPVTEIIKNS